MSTNTSTTPADTGSCCSLSSYLQIVGISFATFFVLFVLIRSLRCLRDQRTPANRGGHQTGAGGVVSDAIAALPTFAFQGSSDGSGKEKGNSMECSICLSFVVEGEMVKLLPRCTHSFHQGCIEMWLKAHPTCPICRTEVIGPIDV
ncbi:RING-H2 finger protein ATL3-like [Typha angustifolia]|uniref:RING-H2 finger protein ATL3-like n=1 Tax=Typha angustifolia TaxID=59011 RepID=UPI003C2D15D6